MASFESIAIISGDDEHDEVWVAVARTINGSTVRHIERFKSREFADLDDAYFVDDGLTYDSTSTTTITGLDHLEAETVAVLADGTVQNSKTVSSGQITLDEAASTVQVGLPITYQVQPMELNLQGTAQTVWKNIVHILVRLYRSIGGQYGRDSDNLDDIPYTTTTHDTGPSVYSGIKRLPFDGQYEYSGDIMIESNDPLPMTILGIGVKVEAESE